MRSSGGQYFADLEALLAATTPDQLHQALVLGVPAAARNEVSWPVMLLRHVHRSEPAQVGDSVVLLATDPRWARARGLMAALARSGLVPDDVLDGVAETFLEEGEPLWWRCPDHWSEDGAGPTAVARRVTVDARRWAVHRLVSEDPQRCSSVLRRAAGAPPAVAAGLLLGLLDAADVLGETALDRVERAAVASSEMTVRHAALRRIAERDRAAAMSLAAADPNQRIRAWGRALPVAAKAPSRPGAPQAPAPGPVTPGADDAQATLF